MAEDKDRRVIIFDFEMYDNLQESFKTHHIWSNEEIHYEIMKWFSSNAKEVNQSDINKLKEILVKL